MEKKKGINSTRNFETRIQMEVYSRLEDPKKPNPKLVVAKVKGP